MKQMVCEMCGSNDIIKENGLYVCQYCGTKYSVDEARKMMIEGTVNVAGTVKIDKTDQISVFYELAETAYKSNNLKEAELYCTKIIEINPRDTAIWLLKGNAVGKQSTTRQYRLDESVSCIAKAIEYSDDDKKDETRTAAESDFIELSKNVICSAMLDFMNFRSEDNKDCVVNFSNKVKKNIGELREKCGFKINGLEKEIAKIISDYTYKIWNNFIKTEYEKDEKGHPSEFAFRKLLEEADRGIELLKATVDYADDDYISNAVRYEHLIEINEYLIGSCSWKEAYGYENSSQAFVGGFLKAARDTVLDVGQHWYWAKEFTLSAEAIKAKEEENRKYRELIKTCMENAEKNPGNVSDEEMKFLQSKKNEREEAKRNEIKTIKDNYLKPAKAAKRTRNIYTWVSCLCGLLCFILFSITNDLEEVLSTVIALCMIAIIALIALFVYNDKYKKYINEYNNKLDEINKKYN